jgi:lysozyme
MKNIAAKLSALGLSAAMVVAGTFIAPREIAPGDPASFAVHADPIGIPTACYGSVKPGLVVGQQNTEDECAEMFAADLQEHDRQLRQSVKVELSEAEYVAYLSFHYNVGAANFRSSTLLKHLNAGKHIDACIELTHACSEKQGTCKGWIYAGDKPWPGLITRRADERDLCLKGAIDG